VKEEMSFIGILGSLFVGSLKAMAPILVFILIINVIANAEKKLDKKFSTVIALYIGTTLLASFVAVCASFIFKVTVNLNLNVDKTDKIPPSDIGAVFEKLFNNLVENPISAIINGNYLGILFWAILFGIVLRAASAHTKTLIADVSNAVTVCIQWIISLAPFGILGLVYAAVADNGLNIFVNYGALLAVIVGCMLIVSLVINPIIASVMIGKNAYPLVFRCLKESGLHAFFTRSSAANIPVNMRLCEKLGLDKNMYSVSIPLGATINMDGAAITIAVMSLSAAFSTGTPVNFFQGLLLSFLATLAACGASGVAGGSLLLIPLACSLLHVSDVVAMHMIGVGLVIGVVQDSVETALNSSGDVLFAAIAEMRQMKKEGKSFDHILQGKGNIESASEEA
jgi:serine/threonine transporter